VSADARSWREKTENWQALTACAEQQPLSCFSTIGAIADGPHLSTCRGQLLEIELDDQERRALDRLLTERKAVLIEITEDTTQPDSARRAGLIELSVLESILGKLRLRDVTSTAAADLLQRRRSTRRSDAGSINANKPQSIASK
jgi:hypothetical protein